MVYFGGCPTCSCSFSSSFAVDEAYEEYQSVLLLPKGTKFVVVVVVVNVVVVVAYIEVGDLQAELETLGISDDDEEEEDDFESVVAGIIGFRIFFLFFFFMFLFFFFSFSK